jgi:hypothetical protein
MNKTIPFETTAKFKILRIRFDQRGERPGNYLTLMKEIKDMNKWNDLSHAWVKRINIV